MTGNERGPWDTEVAWTECPAPKASNSVQIRPQWKPTDHLFVEFTKHQRRPRSGRMVEGSSSNQAVLSVTDVVKDGYILEWAFKSSDLLGSNLPGVSGQFPKVKKILEEIGEIKIQYKVGSDGAYKGIQDLDTVRRQFEESSNRFLEYMTTLGMEPEVLKATRSIMEQLTKNSQMLETVATEDIQVIHSPYGWSFEGSEIQEYDIEVAIPFAGKNIPGTMTIQLTRFGEKEDCAEIVTLSEPNPEAMRTIVLQFLGQMTSQMGKPTPKAEDVPETFRREDKMVFRLRPSTGWPLAIQTTQTVKMQDHEALEQKTYRFQDKPFTPIDTSTQPPD